MLDARKIRALCLNGEAYDHGRRLQASGHVEALDIENPDPGYYIVHARVTEGASDSCFVSLDVDLALDEVPEHSCSCAECKPTKLCAHRVAALLETLDQLKVSDRSAKVADEARQSATKESLLKIDGVITGAELAENMKAQELAGTAPVPVRQHEFHGDTAGTQGRSDPGVIGLMRSYAQAAPTTPELPESLVSLAQETQERVRLVPILVHTPYSGWSLSLKIGRSHLYVVKNVDTLLGAFEFGKTLTYGKDLTFEHDRAALSPLDDALVDFLQAVTQSQNSSRGSYGRWYMNARNGKEMRLSDRDVMELLSLYHDEGIDVDLRDNGSISKSTSHAMVLEDNPPLSYALRSGNQEDSGDDGFTLELPTVPAWPLTSGKRTYIEYSGNFYHCTPRYARSMVPLLRQLEATDAGQELFIAKDDMSAFCSTVVPALRTADALDTALDLSSFAPPAAAFSFYLDRADQRFICDAKVSYGSTTYDLGVRTLAASLARDLRAEANVESLVEALFPERTPDKHLPCFSDDDDTRAYFLLTSGVRELERLGEVFLSEAMRHLKVQNVPQVHMGVSLSSDLMDIAVSTTGLSVKEMRAYLDSFRKHKRFHRLSNGDLVDLSTGNLDEVSEFLDCMQVDPIKMSADGLTVPRYRAFFLMEESKRLDAIDFQVDDAYQRLVDRLDGDEPRSYALPKGLKGTLRPYQLIGYQWLRMLDDLGLCGVLADEMGLGKTIQAIALICSYVERVEREHRLPSLVVCPASLVYNWGSEFARFAPDVDVCLLVGSRTEREQLMASVAEHDVVVTSYDLLKRDVELYREHDFRFMLLDEAQFVKNPATKAARAVRQIASQVRFALTGTPIENRLDELWSIFDFLMPGLLGTRKGFDERYAQPIVQQQDEEATNRLRLMVKPFILRRLKRDVLTDLPDKNEMVLTARMEGEQRKLYDASEMNLKLALEHQLPEEFRRGKIAVLAELTRLREMCCDPHLVYDNYHDESAKLDLCIELLDEACEGGHKVLVFSQFTRMLAIIGKRLDDKGVAYHELTGATSKEERARLVESFATDDVQVFLISLKAGGTGLNLTAANIVIHFDPWWNLAAQNQATDRVHRIGQERDVSVFKLIAENSIEERVVALQESKRDLVEQVIGGADASAATLTRDDLLQLLEG